MLCQHFFPKVALYFGFTSKEHWFMFKLFKYSGLEPLMYVCIGMWSLSSSCRFLKVIFFRQWILLFYAFSLLKSFKFSVQNLESIPKSLMIYIWKMFSLAHKIALISEISQNWTKSKRFVVKLKSKYESTKTLSKITGFWQKQRERISNQKYYKVLHCRKLKALFLVNYLKSSFFRCQNDVNIYYLWSWEVSSRTVAYLSRVTCVFV